MYIFVNIKYVILYLLINKMTINQIILYKNNCIQIDPNQIYQQKDFEKNPFIQIHSNNKSDSKSVYCIIMYDIHAPNPINSYLSPYLHWIMLDIQFEENKPINCYDFINYVPPTPPFGTHTYIVACYQQNELLKNKKIPKINKLSNFDIENFVKQCNLKLITETKFQVTKS